MFVSDLNLPDAGFVASPCSQAVAVYETSR